MNVSAADFRRHFELLSDAALLGTSRDDLTELARESYDEEIARRGLAEGEVASDELAGNGVAAPEGEADQMVLIATYIVAEEASLARGLLESAEIPSKIATDYVAMGPAEFQLLVPKEFGEQALEILEYEISDEELAAQAEAAELGER